LAEQEKFAAFVAEELRKNNFPFAINAGKWFYDYENKKWFEENKKILDFILWN
jgi:hypothetical protein